MKNKVTRVGVGLIVILVIAYLSSYLWVRARSLRPGRNDLTLGYYRDVPAAENNAAELKEVEFMIFANRVFGPLIYLDEKFTGREFAALEELEIARIIIESRVTDDGYE